MSAEAVQDLFAKLEMHIKADAHDDIIQVCNAILAASPGDTDATHCKLVCLIELGKTEDALQLLQSTPGLAAERPMEHAYCLYQLHREREAFTLLQELRTPQEAVLAAQIKYRLGEYNEASALFQKAEELGGASSELSTNILAALVGAERYSDALACASTPPPTQDNSSLQFEFYYNHACAAIGARKLVDAQQLIGKALTVCRETLSTEDYSEEEIEVELGVLTAQAAYINQCMGEEDTASKAYDALSSFKSELDPAVAAVAANNMVALRGQRDLFDSWKKCRANLSDAVSKKITPRQRHAFLFNAALLTMHMNKADDCRQLLGQLEKAFPSSDAPALIRAALLMRGKQPKQCEELLEEAASKAATPTAALLTLAQLHLQAREPEKALSALQRITALRGSPAMVATLVALHERLGDIDGAAAGFEGHDDPQILRAAAAFFARHRRWEAAAAAHEKLLAADPRDMQSLAGLVIATSYIDSALANEHYARLEMMCPPQAEDESMLDVEELERCALPRTGRRAGGAVDRKRQGEEEGAGARSKKKRKRKKPPIYPKGFDPENPGPPPDPERWLPKRERSTYRQRKKDKRAGLSRGPQGLATGAAKVDARTTTNIQIMTDAERMKLKAEQEAKERAEAAAAAAVAASAKKKNKKDKGKGKW
ncbi:hypothetical protein AB1Y20_009871 [Prymnesium parvum]|uniref:Signal recognition particle subunit SRP72 n=1 Tax=Prymnesium parvum TaxID=97485 RepID=A0AB34K233_PRYPA